MLDVPPLRANKISKTGCSIIIDVPGHDARGLQEIQFASSTNCEAKCVEFYGASSSEGGPEAVIVDPPVLVYLKLLFGRGAG